MKVDFLNIWDLSHLPIVDKSISYSICVGDLVINDISFEEIASIKHSADYDSSLLDAVFTHREILWHSDELLEKSRLLPSLNIFNSFCKEIIEEMSVSPSKTTKLYIQLLGGIADKCKKMSEMLNDDENSLKPLLKQFRLEMFPFIKFFLHHPQNKLSSYQPALHRLNYFVFVMITQFHAKYTEFKEPYWEVVFPNVDETVAKHQLFLDKKIANLN